MEAILEMLKHAGGGKTHTHTHTHTVRLSKSASAVPRETFF